MRLHGWWYVVSIVWASALCLASVESMRSRAGSGQASLPERERHIWTSAMHDSEFASYPARRESQHMRSGPTSAGAGHARSLAGRSGRKFEGGASFIIGTDGRVHSALILESAGPVRRPDGIGGGSSILALSSRVVQWRSDRLGSEGGVFQSLRKISTRMGVIGRWNRKGTQIRNG